MLKSRKAELKQRIKISLAKMLACFSMIIVKIIRFNFTKAKPPIFRIPTKQSIPITPSNPLRCLNFRFLYVFPT